MDVQRSIVARMRPHLTGVLQVAGFGCMAYAAGMWLLPVGIALAGAFLVLTGWLVERDGAA